MKCAWCLYILPKHAEMCRNNTANVLKEIRQGDEIMKEEGYDAVKDSGERREFSTGSVRDVRSGKGRYDLIPPYPLKRLAQHYENGAVKYGDRNWEKGQPLSSYADSMLRHCQDYLAGDRSEDHLAAVAWNSFAIMFTEAMLRQGKLPTKFNDMPTSIEARPDYTPEQPVIEPPGIGSASELPF